MKTYREVAIEAVKEAGSDLLHLSKEKIKYQMKNSHDILAEGDLQSESIVIRKIKEYFPEHSIFSEEQGEEIRNSDFLWVLDPLDGTINFSRHIEEYCISLALSHKNEIVLGVIYQPVTNKLYVAEKECGAYLNEAKIAVSSEKELVNCLVAIDNSSKLDQRLQTFQKIEKIYRRVRHLRIFGCAALHLARIAEGQIDFYFKSPFHYWDYAAGMLIVQEAGGKVTDYEGNPITRNSKNIFASNGIIHTAALEAINNQTI